MKTHKIKYYKYKTKQTTKKQKKKSQKQVNNKKKATQKVTMPYEMEKVFNEMIQESYIETERKEEETRFVVSPKPIAHLNKYRFRLALDSIKLDCLPSIQEDFCDGDFSPSSKLSSDEEKVAAPRIKQNRKRSNAL